MVGEAIAYVLKFAYVLLLESFTHRQVHRRPLFDRKGLVDCLANEGLTERQLGLRTYALLPENPVLLNLGKRLS